MQVVPYRVRPGHQVTFYRNGQNLQRAKVIGVGPNSFEVEWRNSTGVYGKIILHSEHFNIVYSKLSYFLYVLMIILSVVSVFFVLAVFSNYKNGCLVEKNGWLSNSNKTINNCSTIWKVKIFKNKFQNMFLLNFFSFFRPSGLPSVIQSDHFGDLFGLQRLVT